MNRIVKLFTILAVLALNACTDSEDDLYTPEQGIYVISQTSNNPWSISFYQLSSGTVLLDYFGVNNPQIDISGDNVIDFVKRRNNGYLLASTGENKGIIRQIDFETFKQATTINLDFQPAGILFITDSIIAISDASKEEIKRYDLKEYKFITPLSGLDHLPGKMMIKGKFLYVTSLNTPEVSVLDHSSNNVEAVIPTQNIPQSIVMDASNYAWIYNNGGGLTKAKHLSWENSLITEEFNFSTESGDAGFNLGISPSLAYVYYYDNGVKRHFINNNTLPELNYIKNDNTSQYGGFNIDGRSGNTYYIEKGANRDKLLIYRADGVSVMTLEVAEGAIKTVPFY